MSSFFGNLFGKTSPPDAPPEAGGTDEQAASPASPASPPGLAGAPEGALTLTSTRAAHPPDPLPVPALPALPKARYGIDEAISLMRTLPIDENTDLVVRVIKRTLESLQVHLSDIIEDAGRRQESLSAQITEHETSILRLEREAEARRAQIAHLQDELAETSAVRGRLELAEQLPPTPAAPRVTLGSGPGAKKVGPGAMRSAPPLPPTAASHRPKVPAGDAKKSVSPAAPAVASPADDDDAMPVESRDLFDKTS